MAKTLLEIYKMLKEGAAPRPPTSSAQAKPLGGNSNLGSSSIVPNANPSQEKINNSRSLRNTTLPPGTNQTARPLPMGGSVPGRQVNSTMIAAKSPTMQGRPAGSPTQAVNVSNKSPASKTPSVNAATGGANPTDNQRQAGMSITNVRDAMYGKNPTAKAAAGPTVNTGGSGAGPVPNAERPRAPAPVPNKGMANSPLNQTGGAGAAASTYNATKNKNLSRADAIIQGRAKEQSANIKQSVVKQNAIQQAGKIGPAAGGGDYKSAQKPSVVPTGNPNAAGGARTPVKPVQPVQKKVNKQPVQNKLKPVRKQPSTGAVKTKPVKKGPRLQSRYQRDSLAGPGN